MSENAAITLLRRVPFLHGLDEKGLETLFQGLERQEYEPGEAVILQGARPEAMYFLASGRVEVLQKATDAPTRRFGQFGRGDTVGEIEMIYRQPRQASVRSIEPTTVYRWERAHMARFMKRHPDVLMNLRAFVRGQLLARRLRFPWLGPDEVVHNVARKHSALLYEAMILPVMFLAASGGLILWGALQEIDLLPWIGAGLALCGVLLGAWRIVDWGNDYYILTNQRAVWLEKVVGIYDSRREAPLHTVLSVSVSTEVVGRLLGYGDVVIRTYTGQVVFRNVGCPRMLAAQLEELGRRVRSQREAMDREGLREIVRERLGEQAASDEGEGFEDLDEEPVGDDRTGLDRWNFKLRFEDADVITYRKHWAVLLREIGAPSILILALVSIAAGRAGGLLQISTISTVLLLGAGLLIPAIAWWVYRFADWANDIYQITPDQIRDIYKKPLGREVRKVAPLENILGTEVDRKGLVGILLNYGDVIANVGTEQFQFQGVYHPVGAQQDIVHAQEAFLQRKHQRDRRRRQGEMVELLDIYHNEVAGREAGQDPPEETDGHS
jgi:hypothetical protein